MKEMSQAKTVMESGYPDLDCQAFDQSQLRVEAPSGLNAFQDVSESDDFVLNSESNRLPRDMKTIFLKDALESKSEGSDCDLFEEVGEFTSKMNEESRHIELSENSMESDEFTFMFPEV